MFLYNFVHNKQNERLQWSVKNQNPRKVRSYKFSHYRNNSNARLHMMMV